MRELQRQVPRRAAQRRNLLQPARGTQPALIYMHGGGWMQGSPETHWDITARIAAWNKQTVISVDAAGAAMYCADDAARANDPLVAPLAAESHGGLPTAYIATAMNVPLRDSGIAYSDALEAAGVPVTRDAGEGLIHGYLRAMEYCKDSLSSLERMAAWLKDENAK